MPSVVTKCHYISSFKIKHRTNMNCETASKVWNHEDGFIDGVRKHLPGVVEHLDRLVSNCINGNEDSFNESVQKEAPGNYYVEHAPRGSEIADNTHDVVGDEAGSEILDLFFSEKYGQEIHLANICCGSCAIVIGPSLNHKEKLQLQMAAINAPHLH